MKILEDTTGTVFVIILEGRSEARDIVNGLDKLLKGGELNKSSRSYKLLQRFVADIDAF